MSTLTLQRGAEPVPPPSFAGNVSRGPTERAVHGLLATCALVTVATTHASVQRGKGFNEYERKEFKSPSPQIQRGGHTPRAQRAVTTPSIVAAERVHQRSRISGRPGAGPASDPCSNRCVALSRWVRLRHNPGRAGS